MWLHSLHMFKKMWRLDDAKHSPDHDASMVGNVRNDEMQEPAGYRGGADGSVELTANSLPCTS